MNPRLLIAGLSLSATALVGIAVHESYTETAVVPTKGDRPTFGFGSTYKAPGVPVQMGDKTNPVEALKRTADHIARDESALKGCVTGPLTQGEYDVLVGFAYQYGAKAACASSMVKHVNAGRYAEACDAYLLYRFAAGYDCSTTIDGRPNRRCWGVWTRSQDNQRKCRAAAGVPPSLGATG